jgi:hypothetical protein
MRRTLQAVVLGTGFVLASAGGAGAAQFPGWGDTGWVYASKRECCNGAIALAQQYSAEACVQTGGVPRPTSGAQRGSCRWDWTQDADGNTLYRCYGEAAIWCR